MLSKHDRSIKRSETGEAIARLYRGELAPAKVIEDLPAPSTQNLLAILGVALTFLLASMHDEIDRARQREADLRAEIQRLEEIRQGFARNVGAFVVGDGNHAYCKLQGISPNWEHAAMAKCTELAKVVVYGRAEPSTN